MFNLTKIALSAAIILSTAFSALTAANAQPAGSGTGVPMIGTAASVRVATASYILRSNKAARSAALSFQGGSLSQAAITSNEILINKS